MEENQSHKESENQEEASKLERLISEIQTTNKLLAYTFDLKRVIIRGVVTGLFTVFGATVIAGIVISFVRFVFGDVPFIN